MIWVNGQRVPINNFPDGTPRLNVSLKGTEGYNEIIWRYEGEFECMSIWCIKDGHLLKESNLYEIRNRLHKFNF